MRRGEDVSVRIEQRVVSGGWRDSRGRERDESSLVAVGDGIGLSRSGGEPRVVTPVTRRASLGQARPRAA